MAVIGGLFLDLRNPSSLSHFKTGGSRVLANPTLATTKPDVKGSSFL